MKNDYIKKIAENPIWLLLSAIAVFYSINIYYCNIFLNSLSQGDFGRDLYNFHLVSKGCLPYIDFNWIYGPLSPILYGLNFKLFGESILNALNLWFLMYIVICFLMYYLVKYFSNNFTAFLSVIFFIGYYCFTITTFNHIIGLIFILLSVFFFIIHLETKDPKYLYLIAISCFLLNITKLNIGIGFSAGLLGSLYILNLIDKKQTKHIIYASILSLTLTLIVYCGLWVYAPIEQISKCFPYGGKQHQLFQLSFSDKYFSVESGILTAYIYNNPYTKLLFFITSLNIWYFIIPIVAFITSIYIYIKEKITNDILFLIPLSICALILTHEFVMNGSFYSLRLWVLPIDIIIFLYTAMFFITHINNRTYLKIVSSILIVIFIFIIGFKYYSVNTYKETVAHLYPHKRVNISFTNYQWLLLASQAVNYIENNTKLNEKVLTLPYNSFYNFVTNRDQPSRITEFSYISNINQKDEIIIISDMEKNKVKLIMYVVRGNEKKSAVGKFGSTHCKLLDKYIQKNYYISQIFQSNNTDNNILYPIVFYKRKTPFNE